MRGFWEERSKVGDQSTGDGQAAVWNPFEFWRNLLGDLGYIHVFTTQFSERSNDEYS